MRLIPEAHVGVTGLSASAHSAGGPAGRQRRRHPQGRVATRAPAEARHSPDPDRVRVLLAEADVLTGEGLSRVLEDEGFEIVAIGRDADDLLRLARELRPRLVITEVGLPGTDGDGLDAMLRLRRETPAIAVLILSAIADVSRGVELLVSGPGVGYLLRHRVTDIPRFMLELRRLVAGGVVVEPALLEEFVMARQLADPLRALSPRERDVLTLVAQGHSNAHVAERLWITRDTVEKHIQSIFFKLGIPEDDRFHRRVVAVLAYLGATRAPSRDGPARVP